MRDISVIWARIEEHQNERFKTITGQSFTYTVNGTRLITDRTDYPIHRGQFEKALQLVPFDRPSAISRIIRGPAYVWAILHDERIRQRDW